MRNKYKFPLAPCDVCETPFHKHFENQIICGKECRDAREEFKKIMRDIDYKLNSVYQRK